MGDSESLDTLLKELETSLANLLDRVRNDPWSLLMIQTLLWSFRRWAIYHLSSEDVHDQLKEYVWDSHIDLVQRFAPDGLREFGTVWLHPHNVGDRVDMLEELNGFFLCVVDHIDDAILKDNDDAQNGMAIFLDDTITEIVTEWLKDRTYYRIYPSATDSSDTFPTDRIFTIMQLILEKTVRGEIAETKRPEPVAVAEPMPTRPSSPSSIELYPPPPPPEETPPATIAKAIQRRKTLRVKRFRTEGLKGTRKQHLIR